MSRTLSRKPLALAIGAAFTASMAAAPLAQADTANPFGMTDLGSGYTVSMIVGDDKDREGKCGEGKKDKEGKKHKEGKCGEGKKDKEGKCGEGKCGEGKKDKDHKKDKDREGKCGAA